MKELKVKLDWDGEKDLNLYLFNQQGRMIDSSINDKPEFISY